MKRPIFHYIYNDKIDLSIIRDEERHFKVAMKDHMILNSAGRPKDTKCICKNYLITEYIKAEVEK